MMRRCFLLFGLLLLTPLVLHAQSPFERLTARTGTTVSPEARRYFGLVPTAPPGTSVGIDATAGDGLALTLRRPSLADTTLVLSPERADDLARYVDRYEELYWDERDESRVTWDLGPSLTRLRRDAIAVPTTLKREVAFSYTLRLSDGARLRGRVLRADDQTVVLWSGSGPYRWDRLDEISVVPTASIERADVAGASIVPLATGVVAQAAGVAAVLVPSKRARAAALGLAVVSGGFNAFLRTTKARGVDAVRSLRRVAFFRNGEPPELQARIDQAPTESAWAARALRPSLAERWRRNGPFLSVSMAAHEERTPQSSYRTYFGGLGGLANVVTPYYTQNLTFVESPRYRGDVEVHVPVPKLPLGVLAGVSQAWFDDPPETINGVAPVFQESIVDRASTGLYAGLSVGGYRTSHFSQRLTLAAGFRRDRATLSGAMYSTRTLYGFPAVTDTLVRRYDEPIRHRSPMARAMYEIFLTRYTPSSPTWSGAPRGVTRWTRG